MLEDTPRNVYFFLATTHPNELLDTIRTRCTIVHVQRIAPDLLANHVADVARREGREVSQEVLDRIVECADGSARKALVLLHQVFGLGTEAEQLAAITKSDTRRQAFDIVKALLWERTTWADMCKILRNVEDEPEQIRRLVLANAGKEILKAGKSAARARMILSAFECDFFASGREGLYGACWDVLMPAP